MSDRTRKNTEVQGLTIKAVLLFLLCALVYFPQLNNSFLCDDYRHLPSDDARQAAAASPSGFFGASDFQHYSPYDKMLNSALFRNLPHDRPAFFRAVNLALFSMNGILVLILAYFLTKSQRIAFGTALFFCLHPLNAEMLNHITFNSVFLFAAFFLASFTTYIVYDQKRHASFLLLSVFFFLNAQLTLEFSILFPGLLFLYLFLLRQYSFGKSIQAMFPFLLLAAAHSVIWMYTAASSSQFFVRALDLGLTPLSYLASFSYLANWFLLNMVFPRDIVFILNIYPLPDGPTQHIFLGVMALEIVFLLVVITRFWKKSAKTFALLWLALGFLPALAACLGHTYMGLVFEPYWMYVPSIGAFLLLAILLGPSPADTGRCRWAKNICVLGLCLYFLFFSVRYIRIGKTANIYYSNWCQKSPHNYIALCNMAQEYFYEREYAKALQYYERAIRSILKPSLYPPTVAYLGAGQIYHLQRRYEEAKATLNALIRLSPREPYPYFVLGVIAEEAGHLSEAEAYYRKAVDLAPSFLKASLKLSGLYEAQGDRKAAAGILEHARKNAGRSQGRKEILLRLTAVYLEDKRYEKIVVLFEDLVPQDKDGEGCTALLGLINEKGAYALGLDITNGIAPLFKENKELYLLKGIFLANLGQYREAMNAWGQGWRLDRTDARFQTNIRRTEGLISTREKDLVPW